MDQSDGSQSDRGEPVDKKMRGNTKVRGTTKMGALVARHQEQRERLHVDFDADMNPHGVEEDRFISYLGYLARSKVPIVYPDWKSVPKKTKEMIWQQILQTYDVPDNKVMNKHWMGEVRLRWKDFKNKLSRYYIRGARKGEDPCQRYSYLSPYDWRLFVASRQDPKFMELSEANKEKQAANNYQHYMSRGGYRKLERRMMEEELEKMKEAAKSDPSIVVQAPDRPPRHKKWKLGRLKGEKYINPIVAEVASKIDELEQQSSQGSFNPSARMDILSTAIGKPDRSGQVRGEPRGVGVAKYFGRASQYSSQGEPSRELVAKVREEVRQELEVELRQSLREELLKELRGEMRSIIQSERENEACRTQESPAFPSTKGSYNPPEVPLDDPSLTPEAGEPCTLYVEVPLLRHVADALVHIQATTHHHKQIPDNLRRVTVTCVREGEEGIAIPVPDEEVATLGQAIRSFILWPKHLIHMAATPPMDEQNEIQFPFLVRLQQIHNDIGQIDMQMPYGIVGARLSYPFTIDRKDLKDFINLQELDMGWIIVAIIFFQNMCVDLRRNDLYGFLCPSQTTKKNNKLEVRTSYVGYTMGETKLPCYLAPIIEGYHWTLCVVSPVKNALYWFDSLGRKPNKEIRSIFSTALKTYRLLGGTREGKSREPKWYYPRCPRQPSSTECGYYVILYMYNIIQSGATTDFEQIFGDAEVYLDEDINLIRDLLSGHILQHIEE